jgi:hypothetical protein
MRRGPSKRGELYPALMTLLGTAVLGAAPAIPALEAAAAAATSDGTAPAPDACENELARLTRALLLPPPPGVELKRSDAAAA